MLSSYIILTEFNVIKAKNMVNNEVLKNELNVPIELSEQSLFSHIFASV